MPAAPVVDHCFVSECALPRPPAPCVGGVGLGRSHPDPVVTFVPHRLQSFRPSTSPRTWLHTRPTRSRRNTSAQEHGRQCTSLCTDGPRLIFEFSSPTPPATGARLPPASPPAEPSPPIHITGKGVSAGSLFFLSFESVSPHDVLARCLMNGPPRH